jgi:hypothetical protein
LKLKFMELRPSDCYLAQEGLIKLGERLQLGCFDARFAAAIQRFQRRAGMPITEKIDKPTLEKILKAAAFIKGVKPATTHVNLDDIAQLGSQDHNCPVVCLGRYGDVINALGIAQARSQAFRQPVPFVISRHYASILEAADYVDPIILDVDFCRLKEALERVTKKFDKVVLAQVYGINCGLRRKTTSFCLEAWRVAGHLKSWNLAIPVFNRRSASREQELRASIGMKDGENYIAVNTTGFSSPFSRAAQVLEDVQDAAQGQARVINLSDVRAHHLHDLLGIIERCRVLVTIDTATAHLAAATPTPSIIFIADQPTRWHGMRPRGQCLLCATYGDYSHVKDYAFQAISSVLGGSRTPKIIHAYSDYPVTSEDEQKRISLAHSTWQREYLTGAWVAAPFSAKHSLRSSATLGDSRGHFFLKDIIDHAASLAADDDVIAYTNSDIMLMPGITWELLKVTTCACGYRWDFSEPQEFEPTHEDLGTRGSKYVGSDIFAFRKSWWLDVKDQLPDFLVGYEAWDKVFRHLVEEHKGAVLDSCIAHVRHSSFWETAENKRRHPCQLYNCNLAIEWLLERNLSLGELSSLA